jgi:large subunit ribosomal protein L21
VNQTLVLHPAIGTNTSKDLDSQHFAVIKLGGTQYKVVIGDVIVAEKIKNWDIGETHQVDQVLLTGTKDYTKIGRPLVPNASVSLHVEEQTKDEKVIIFKKRRRKNSQRKNGFRREVTLVRVTGIEPGDHVPL